MTRFLRRPSCSGGAAGGSSEVFCGLPSGPRRTWKCSCFFCSPLRLMVTCSTQVYCARVCLFWAMACLTSATRSCISWFWAETGWVILVPPARTSRAGTATPNTRNGAIFISLPSRLSLLLLRRVVLEQFLHGLIEILHVLFLVGTGVNRLGGVAGPDQLLGRGIVHIENKSSDTNRGTGGRSHAAAEAATCAPGVPLPFLIDRDLIADIEIGLLAIGFGQAFGSQLSINGLLDFLIHDLVGVRSAFDSDPLVGVIFGEVGAGHEVILHVLSRQCARSEQHECEEHRR